MENIDPEKAARVWQRVHATATAEPESLQTLIAEEWADAVIYLHLSRAFQGSEQAVLRRMFEEEQAHLACLKGIYAIHTRSVPNLTPPQPPKGTLENILRACYGREMRCLARYEKRAADSEYGPVFAKLAAVEQEHCRQVLELLGKVMAIKQKR